MLLKDSVFVLWINKLYTKKLLIFLLAEKGVQLFCNTSAKCVTQVQITNAFWFAENTKETNKNQAILRTKIQENGLYWFSADDDEI